MKIVVVYGSYEIKARERVFAIKSGVKKKGWQVISLTQDESIDPKVALTSNFLFADEVLYVLDPMDVLSPTQLKEILQVATKLLGNLLIFKNGELSASQKNFFPQDTIFEEFKLTKKLFNFLETYKPKDNSSYQAFRQLVENEPIELLFAMFARQMRDLLWVREGGNPPFPLWKASKLRSQAKFFEDGEIEKYIDELLEIDRKAKTSVMPLGMSLDLFFTMHLQ